MTTRTIRFLGLVAALGLLISLAGCGGGSSGPTINDQLFVPNYVSSLNGLYYWDHLPMRVVFYLPSNWQEIYPSDHDLYLDGVNEWNQTERQALITVVPPGQPTDAAVTFVRQSELGGNVRGRTEATHYSNGRMISATIKVAVDTPWGVVQAGDAQATIAHELGHALGISGHSPYADDLLYTTQVAGQPKTTTTRDLNTAMTAYPSYFSRSFVPATTPSRSPGRPETFVIE